MKVNQFKIGKGRVGTSTSLSFGGLLKAKINKECRTKTIEEIAIKLAEQYGIKDGVITIEDVGFSYVDCTSEQTDLSLIKKD